MPIDRPTRFEMSCTLARLEATLGEDLLGRVEDVLAVDVVARLARLVAGLRVAAAMAELPTIREID